MRSYSSERGWHTGTLAAAAASVSRECRLGQSKPELSGGRKPRRSMQPSSVSRSRTRFGDALYSARDNNLHESELAELNCIKALRIGCHLSLATMLQAVSTGLHMPAEPCQLIVTLQLNTEQSRYAAHAPCTCAHRQTPT